MKTKKMLRHCMGVFGLAGVLLNAAPAHAEPASFEYKLKAVFLLNFAKFVTWPAAAFADSSAPIQICVIGEDPFGDTLDQVVQGEVVQGHTLSVQRPTAGSKLQDCHIAFFTPIRGTSVRQYRFEYPDRRGDEKLPATGRHN